MFQISLFTLGIGNESVQGGSSEDHSTGQGKEMAASGSQVKVIVRQGKMSDAGHAKEVNARRGKEVVNGRQNKGLDANKGNGLKYRMRSSSCWK